MTIDKQYIVKAFFFTQNLNHKFHWLYTDVSSHWTRPRPNHFSESPRRGHFTEALISVPNIPPPRAPSASPRNQSCENPQLYNWIYSSHSPGQNWKDQPDLQAVNSHSLKSDHGVQGRTVQQATQFQWFLECLSRLILGKFCPYYYLRNKLRK